MKVRRRERSYGSAARNLSEMTEDQWSEVDRYFSDSLLPSDPTLESVLDASIAAGLPSISVSPNQGKLLQMLAQIVSARSIL